MFAMLDQDGVIKAFLFLAAPIRSAPWCGCLRPAAELDNQIDWRIVSELFGKDRRRGSRV